MHIFFDFCAIFFDFFSIAALFITLCDLQSPSHYFTDAFSLINHENFTHQATYTSMSLHNERRFNKILTKESF